MEMGWQNEYIQHRKSVQDSNIELLPKNNDDSERHLQEEVPNGNGVEKRIHTTQKCFIYLIFFFFFFFLTLKKPCPNFSDTPLKKNLFRNFFILANLTILGGGAIRKSFHEIMKGYALWVMHVDFLQISDFRGPPK
jgi:hypothetical protein